MSNILNIDTVCWAYSELIRLGMSEKHPFMEKMDAFIKCPDLLIKEINCLEKDLVRTRVENIKLEERIKELDNLLKESVFKTTNVIESLFVHHYPENRKDDYYKIAAQKEKDLNDC